MRRVSKPQVQPISFWMRNDGPGKRLLLSVASHGGDDGLQVADLGGEGEMKQEEASRNGCALVRSASWRSRSSTGAGRRCRSPNRCTGPDAEDAEQAGVLDEFDEVSEVVLAGEVELARRTSCRPDDGVSTVLRPASLAWWSRSAHLGARDAEVGDASGNQPHPPPVED